MAGLSLSLLLVVALLAWQMAGDQPYVAAAPEVTAPASQPALAAQSLLRLEDAVRVAMPRRLALWPRPRIRRPEPCWRR